MSDLTAIVDITISTTNPGVTRAGFSNPLIATPNPSWTEHVRSYTGLTGVATDFATTTAEYAAAAAVFAQSPTVKKLLIGRMGHKPTQVHVIKVESVKNTTAYRVRAWAAGVLQTATYTSDGSATNDEIAAGLASALNALAAPDIGFTSAATGAGGSQVCTVTADAAGNWCSIEVMAEVTDTQVSALLSVKETEVDPSTSTSADLDAIKADSDDFYGVVLLFKSYDISVAAAGWAETNKKLLILSTADTVVATESISTAEDVAEQLLDQARAQTGPMYHPRSYEFFDAAEMGRFFAIPPGKENWRMKALSGVTPVVYTDTQITNMEAKRCNYYYEIGGSNAIGGKGKVSSGQYIDVVRGLAWYEARLGERIVNRLLSLEKLPYTDAGIAIIENEIRAQNKEGIDQGLIADSPAPTVTVPKAADVSDADKLARELNGVSTTWTLAGAINKIFVNVQVNA